jgi:hypothetical protein
LELQLTLGLEELQAILTDAAPLRIDVTRDPKEPRVIDIASPELISLVPGKGLLVRTSARIAWPLLGLSVPLKVTTGSLLLYPKIVRRGDTIGVQFDIKLDGVELKSVPQFMGSGIVDRVNASLEKGNEARVWNVSKTLTRIIPLPKFLVPETKLHLEVMAGRLEIRGDRLVLSVDVLPTVVQTRADAERRFALDSLPPRD